MRIDIFHAVLLHDIRNPTFIIYVHSLALFIQACTPYCMTLSGAFPQNRKKCM